MGLQPSSGYNLLIGSALYERNPCLQPFSLSPGWLKVFVSKNALCLRTQFATRESHY